MPPGPKFAPGVVGENYPSPPPSSVFPPGNPSQISGLETSSSLNPPKAKTSEPDIRTSSSSHHVRNGFNNVFGSTTVAVESEIVIGETTSWLRNVNKGDDM